MYVLVTIEDDGWSGETSVKGVYSSLELAKENLRKQLNGLMISYNVAEDKLDEKRDDYAEYYDGERWFKVYYEKFEVDKDV